MPTVYAIDIRRKKRVRLDGVIHFVAHEGTESDDGYDTKPWRMRCGVYAGNLMLEYLGDDEDIVVTCVACLASQPRYVSLA